MHGAGVLLGKVPDREDNYIDLLSEEPVAYKRRKFSGLGRQPYEGYKCCNGFDPESSPRISAAEQIGEDGTDE